MKKLYEKNLLAFALILIGVDVVGMSVLDSLPNALFAAIGAAGGSAFLFLWLKCHHLTAESGLCRSKLPFVWYIPLVIITLGNLWNGFQLTTDPVDTVLFSVKMLGVGFLEELIFRSFLFRAMEKDSVKWAEIVSSVTFGVGHIVNLLNSSGMDLTENLVQIVCAAAIGFAYVMVFLRGGSLLPCVLSHGIFNSLSQFERPGQPAAELTVRAILCLIAVGYGILLYRKKE